MAYGTVNADIIQSSVSGVSLGAGNASIMKNRLINGTQIISQRNGTSSITPAAGGFMTDRWVYNASQASKITAQQGLTGGPAGFPSNLGLTVASAVSSLGATDNFYFQQKIEGFNIADLAWGTASAKPVTLSFWVQSNLTGTFGGAIRNGAENRSYPFSYTISSANTWTQATVTIPGDTTGTWTTDNSAGMSVAFSLGMGSTYSGTAGTWAATNYASCTGATNVMATLSNTFYITGIQLEVGTSATGFEYRQYQQELALCQRYYENNFPIGVSVGNGQAVQDRTACATFFNQSLGVSFSFKVTKRANPTITFYSGSNNNTTAGLPCFYLSTTWTQVSSITPNNTTISEFGINGQTSGATNGSSYIAQIPWTASAEL